jgi:FADH2 O2-dependent halogenase
VATAVGEYGSWQRAYPQVVSGKKRGFSYFAHEPQRAFVPRADHANELMVTASQDDEHSDTQWLRADVDGLIARKLSDSGVPLLERTHISEIRQATDNAGRHWELIGSGEGEAVRVRCDLLIDGTGEGGALAKAFGLSVSAAPLSTRSRALFGHFRQLGSWEAWLRQRGGAVHDHPFCCDDAAQHQLLDGAWMYILRFNNGVTSAGFAIDAERFPRPSDVSPSDEWKIWLQRYPSVQDLFRDSSFVDPPGGIVGTGLLPRRVGQAVGRNWVMLPHTAGFIDPLHSSGIAHSLCGVERLMGCLTRYWGSDELPEQLLAYERAVFGELEFIDRLVHGCYRTLGDFRLFVPFSMLYFAAATWYERQRASANRDFWNERWFLCADELRLCELVKEMHERVVSLTGGPPAADDAVTKFEQDLADGLRPFNIAGLCDPTVRNMYRYTAAPM